MDTKTKTEVRTYEIERFLYAEARMLDEGRFHEWLDLFTDDVRYWMPIRQLLQDRREGIYDLDDLAIAHFNENKAGLEMRIKRLDTGFAHAETPPSHTRHFVSNIEVEPAESPSHVMARSNFLLFQGRHSGQDFLFCGRRQDWLSDVGGQWKIAQRKIVLDHTVLPRGLSVLF